MTLHAHRRRQAARCRRTRVWLNGREVTSRCVYVDGRRGVARLFVLNSAGRPFIREGSVVVEEVRGDVRIGRLKETH